MTVKSVGISLLVIFLFAWASTLVYDISWESAIVLAPVFVIGAAAVGGLSMLWFKAAREGLRRR